MQQSYPMKGIDLANGKGHARAAQGVIVAYIIGAVVLVRMGIMSVLLALLLLPGFFLGLYANPDVRDQQSVRNYGEHLVDRHWGKVLGRLWSLWWYPLAANIPHRNWASHLPVIGTLIAWLWLFMPILIVVRVWHVEYFPLLLLVAVCSLPGWSIQDFIHLVQDGWRIRW